MSIHSSLRGGGVGGVKHRNVLTRQERMDKLAEDGRWNENKSMFALPKVRSIKITVKKKKKEADDGAAAKKK